MSEVYILAKIKFDLRDPDEAIFAQREIDSLLETKTEKIITLASLFKNDPFRSLDDKVVHLITRLTYLGEIQGYLAKTQLKELLSVVRRCTFFRELYVIYESDDLKQSLETIGLKFDKKIKSGGDLNPYTQIFISERENSKNKLITLRFIPFHTLFEYATEVKKLPSCVFRPKNNEDWEGYFSEKERGVEKEIPQLLEHLKRGNHRSPHFGLGKNHIGDFVDWASTDLRKPFLHYLHKYKGKGDPRISRALINLLKVKEKETILDPFAGSGAFISDAPTMGINAIGVEVLNIGKIIGEVKSNLSINLKEVKREIVTLFNSIDKGFHFTEIKEKLLNLTEMVKKYNLGESSFGKIKPHLEKVLFIKEKIDKIEKEEIKKFLTVLLSQQIVEFSEKSRSIDIINSFKSYVEDRYLILYATQKMGEILKINFKDGFINIIRGDSTTLSFIEDGKIDGILTSPPYFDALDYIGNNKISILILGLYDDLKLESTKKFYEEKNRNDKSLQPSLLFVGEGYDSINLPKTSLNLIELLEQSQRSTKALVVKDYLKMMALSFKECFRVLKKGKYYLMVISKCHIWTINGKEEVIETSTILADLGSSSGFKLVDVIEHGLSKADKGKIGIEDILVFQK
jgi:tRNA G10  N-methylase Trm11